MKLLKALLALGTCMVLISALSAHLEELSMNQKEDWQSLLKKSPIPDGAIKLIKVREFPSEAVEEKGEGIGQAMSLSVDSQGDIYVPDWKYNQIHKFNLNGELISKFGRAGQGPGEFNRPRNIVFDREGNYFVKEIGRRIQKFDETNKYLNTIKLLKPYSEYFIAENGNVYAGYSSRDPKEDQLIEILNSDGSVATTFGKKKEFKYHSSTHNEVFITPGDHQIFVLWRYFNIFQRYSPDGDLLFDKKLKYEYFDKISEINDDLMKPEDGSVTSKILFIGLRFYNKRLFTMTSYPRLILFRFDQSGEIKNTYWTEIQEREISRDFAVIEKDGETLVVVLRVFPTVRVVLYAIPK